MCTFNLSLLAHELCTYYAQFYFILMRACDEVHFKLHPSFVVPFSFWTLLFCDFFFVSLVRYEHPHQQGKIAKEVYWIRISFVALQIRNQQMLDNKLGVFCMDEMTFDINRPRWSLHEKYANEKWMTICFRSKMRTNIDFIIRKCVPCCCCCCNGASVVIPFIA